MLKFEPITYHPKYQKCEPICPIKDGEKVLTTTLDAHGGSPSGTRSKGFSNPLTGPFVLPEAQPGDVLLVEIHEIQPLGESGWSYAYPRPWLMESADAAQFPDKMGVHWALDAQQGVTSFDLANGTKVKVPMKPMLGCVGLACDPSTQATSQDAGRFGGNLDFPLLQSGTRLELPVSIPGGYLFVGDAHAIQYGGEMTGAAVEIPAQVIFSATLKKGKPLEWPRGETPEVFFALGTDLPFEKAVQHALSGLIGLLEERFNLSHADAAALAGQLADIQVCNMVSNTYTAACVVSKSVLASAF